LFREKSRSSATAAKEQNQGLISTSKDMTSTKGAENIEKHRIYQRKDLKK
jgi:hypothetical protein